MEKGVFSSREHGMQEILVPLPGTEPRPWQTVRVLTTLDYQQVPREDFNTSVCPLGC